LGVLASGNPRKTKHGRADGNGRRQSRRRSVVVGGGLAVGRSNVELEAETVDFLAVGRREPAMTVAHATLPQTRCINTNTFITIAIIMPPATNLGADQDTLNEAAASVHLSCSPISN